MSTSLPQSELARVAALRDELANLQWLLEQVLIDDPGTSRARIRQALEQNLSRIDVEQKGSKEEWLRDACVTLGRRCQVIRCSAHDIHTLAVDHASILVEHGGGEWLAVTDADDRRVQLARTVPVRTTAWVSASEWETFLSGEDDDLVRAVVIHPDHSIVSGSLEGELTPFSRLWLLIKPEWSDIWIVLIFALIIGLLALATPIAVESLVNTVAFGRFLQPVFILSLLLLTFMSFSGALRAVQTFVVEIIQRRLFARVAADLAFRLPRVRAEEWEGKSGRELVNRFFDVVVVQKVVAQLLLDGVSLLFGTLIGMAMLAFYHPWLLGFDVLLLGMIILIVTVLGRGAVESAIKESKYKYLMAAWLEDLAGCRTVFRYDGANDYALERADHLIFGYLEARARHFRVLMRQIVFALGMHAVASTVLLGLGGFLVISGELTLGQLVAAELIVAVIVGSFAKLGKHMESFYDVLASVDKLGTLFDLPMERQDGVSVHSRIEAASLTVQSVSYHTADHLEVLHGVSLTIKAGERVALMGPCGSGKSTLLDLIYGLRSPVEGQIQLGDIELRELRPTALRKLVALVRTAEIFEGSVLDNVRIGRTSISTEDVREALASVGLLDDLLGLPRQLETQLFSTGNPLTSLQQLRLGLARACVGRPRVLLLDGLLDAFPDEDAQRLIEWLTHRDHPWTLLVVTGREAIAAACDRRIELPRRQPRSLTSHSTHEDADDA